MYHFMKELVLFGDGKKMVLFFLYLLSFVAVKREFLSIRELCVFEVGS